jgi:sugar phosphate isomerase/epimerase
MSNNKIKICVKGSRKTGQIFFRETKYLATISDCIEIDFNYPHDSHFEKEIKYLKKLRNENKINFTVHAQYLSGSLNDFNEKIRQETVRQVLKSIDQAAAIGVKIITLHPALEPYGLKTEKRKELELISYQEIARYAAKKKIKVGLENEAQTCFWFPDRACLINQLIETIKKVNRKNFGLTLDIGHANVTGEDYLAAIKRHSDIIFHIHAHDNIGAAEKNIAKFKRPDPHLSPGKGDIDWKMVIATLHKSCFKGYFELECEIKDLEEAIKYIRSFN